MIKIVIKKKKETIKELILKGHADYDVLGKDIVCAAVSSMAILTINNIISLDDSIIYEEKNGFLKIRVIKDTEFNQVLLTNFVNGLNELKTQYPKNIEIRNED